MARITLTVKDSKAQFLIELLNNFNFVKIEDELSVTHKKIIDEELEFIKKNPKKLVSLNQFKKNAKKHLK